MPKPQEPQRPTPPWEYDYQKKTERRYIYSAFESLQEDDWGDDDDDEDEIEEPKQIAPETPVEQVTLGFLLKHLPEGVTPDMVKIEFGYNASSMSYDDHYVRFYYEVEIPARTKELRAAKKKYQEEQAQYEKDMETWKEACRQYEIQQTEQKLARLKKGT